MSYIIPYEAAFKCPKGHSFMARVGAMEYTAEHRCPVCYEEWVAKNVPNAKQVSEPKRVQTEVTL